MSSTAEEQELEEEEAIILVELNQLPNPDIITTCRGTCSILGIDTPEPVLQLDNFVFKGKFEETLGSCLFFKQDPDGKQLDYVCKTSKKLTMSRVVLKRRQKPGKTREGEEAGHREDRKEVGEEEESAGAMDVTESTADTS